MSINDEELLAQHHFPLVLIAAAHSAELVVLGTCGRRKYPHTVTYGPNAFYCVPKGAGWPSHQGFSKKHVSHFKPPRTNFAESPSNLPDYALTICRDSKASSRLDKTDVCDALWRLCVHTDTKSPKASHHEGEDKTSTSAWS
jgi:hypothetical protein